MVLDEASSFATSDSPSNSSFSSSDPATSGYGSAISLPQTINLSTLPGPMPVFGRLLGYSNDRLKKHIEDNGNFMSRVLQRPLTYTEWEATAFHMAKLQHYASYGWPVGILAGSLRAYQTMDTMRFPLYKPDLEKYRFNSFPGTTSAQTARQAWQSLRFLTYGAVGGSFIKAIVTAYAINVAWAGRRVDPRLEDFWTVLSGMSTPEIKQRVEGPMPSEDANNSISTAPSLEEQRQSESQRRYQSAWEHRRAGAAGAPQPPTAASASPTSSFPADDYDFDDASPMARGSSPGGNKDAFENAWDRVRQGKPASSSANQVVRPIRGMQGVQDDAWDAVRSRGTSGDQSSRSQPNSFSFSSSDQDGQLAREETQRDFDARVEKERDGGSFEDSSGRRRFG